MKTSTRQYIHFDFLPSFLDVDNSVNIIQKVSKSSGHILAIVIEVTVSQIFFI